MNIVILGPQGSGKGTQAKLLAQKFGLFYFESGEFLREISLKNDKVREVLDKGELVNEKELTSYITAYLDEKQIYNNIIFDGFPRTIGQYKFFSEWLEEKKVGINLVIILEVSEETTLARLAKRDREDDTNGAIKIRLEVYKKETV